MPVPKRKVSRARKGKRSANKFIKAKAFCACSNCQAAILPHQACRYCGFYKGVKVTVTKAEKTSKKKETKVKDKSEKVKSESAE